MALPLSGPISMADIRDEFGDTNPVSLTEFYAGAGRVPAGTMGGAGAIPSSGLISLGNFLGASGSLLGGAGWKLVTPAYPVGRLNRGDSGSRLLSFNNGAAHISNDGGYTWTREVCNVLPVPIGIPSFNYLLEATYNEGYFYACMQGYRQYSSAAGSGYTNAQFAVRSTNGKDWVYPSGVAQDVGSDSVSGPSNSTMYPVGFGKVGLLTTAVFLTTTARTAGGMWTYHYSSMDDFTSVSSGTLPDATYQGIADTPVYLPDAAYGIQQGGSGVLIAVSRTPSIAVSVTGVSWVTPTLRDPQGNVITTNVAVGDKVIFGGKFYAACTGGRILSTQDGQNFVLSEVGAIPDCPSTVVPLMAACDTYAVAVFKNASGIHVVKITTDFSSWTNIPALTLAAANPSQLKWAGSNWVIVSGGSLYVVPV